LEYFQYLLDQIERCHTSNPQDDPSNSFKFVVEERILCSASGKVKYNKKADNVLSLSIPLQAAINKGKYRSREFIGFPYIICEPWVFIIKVQ
jgi:ubiquitin carboxyl-terminal hydrolase 5/13